MKRLLFILILFSCQAETETRHSDIEEKESPKQVKLQLSSRIDTSNSEIKEILSLYEHYINSQPDSIYDNPYWNSVEKNLYKDFDFSRSSIYNGLNSSQLFRIYSPFVLSVEPINEKYQIKVLYSNSATDPPYVGSKVWCIHMLIAVREKGNWKLENYLWEKTKNWQKRKSGFIEYVFPKAHQFDIERANIANAFCKDIIKRFNPGFNSTFSFYLANGKDEMGELENFDYYFTGITTGKAREGMILSSKKDEFYPHEFIHKLLPQNENRGHVMEEGLATFLGTKEDLDEYLPMMQKLARDYQTIASYSIKNILNNETEWNGYPVAYPGGALICEVINEIKGDAGINKLIAGDTRSYEEIMSLTADVLQMKEHEVIQLIEKKLKEYE